MSSKQIQQNVIRWIYILLIQLFILNNVLIGGYLNPYFYVLIVILWPLRMAPISSLVLAFCTGLVVDFMMNTAGIHAASLTAVAFIRLGLIKRIRRRNDELQDVSFAEMGPVGFMAYAAILTWIHHFILFNLDVFRLDEIFNVFSRSLVSALLTFVLILLHQLLSQSGRRHVL